MTAEQRAHLIRERFKANGGIPYVASGRQPKAPVVLPKPTGRGFVSCGPALNGIPPAWVKAVDSAPALTVRVNHRRGRTTLTKIAELLPAKLPRVSLSQ